MFGALDSHPRTNTRKYFWAIIVVGLVLYLIGFNSFPVGIYQDDASYIVLARSIATGQGYARISYPVAEPELAWPPVYPILLTPLVALWPFNFLPLKILSLLLTLLALYVLKKYLDERDASHAILVVALCALNLTIVRHASMVMAEPAYMVFSLLALYLFERFSRANFNRWHHLPLIALATVLAAQTRLIGVALAIACVLVLLSRRQLKHTLAFGLLVALGMSVEFFLARQAGGTLFPPDVAAEVDPLANAAKILPNFRAYLWVHLPNLLFGAFGETTDALAGRFGLAWVVVIAKAGLLGLTLLGLVRTILRRLTPGEIYVLVYLTVICIKTFDGVNDATPRYLVPLFPFIYLYTLDGIDWLAGKLARRLANPAIPRVAVACLVVPLLLIFVYRGIDNAAHPQTAVAPDLSSGASWIAQNAAPDAIVMCINPIQRYIYTQRHTVRYPYPGDQPGLLDSIRQQKVAYVLVGPPVQMADTIRLDDYQVQEVLPAMQADPARFELVYQDAKEQVAVYRVRTGQG
jgi:hypothetical protein